jgi:hypothetical protein
LTPDGRPLHLTDDGRVAVEDVEAGRTLRLGEPWVHGFELVGDDRLLTLSSHGSALWDLGTGARVGSPRPLCPGRHRLSPERHLCLGGPVRRYVDAAGETLLSIVSDAEGAWVAWTPDGRLDHSEGGLSLVTLVRDGEPCEAAVCARGRRVPGLLDIAARAEPSR